MDSNLIKLTLEWGQDKGILSPENKFKQYAKMIEELGEYAESHQLCSDQQASEMGDVFVTLIILMSQTGVSPFAIFRDSLSTYNRAGQWIKGWDSSDTYILRNAAKIGGDLFKGRDMQYAYHTFAQALIHRCKFSKLDPSECLQIAYNKISKRTGKTIDGKFIKSEDLNDE